MSVIRWTWACVTAGFVLAMLVGTASVLALARHHLSQDVQRASEAAAQSLVAASPSIDAIAAGAADGSAAQRWAAVAVVDAAGVVRWRAADAAPNGQAPGWFTRALALKVQPATALIVNAPSNAHASFSASAAAGRLGAVAVLARTDAAYELMWRLAQVVVWVVSGAGALVIVGLAMLLRWARGPLEGFEEQIRALAERRFVSVAQPKVREWVDLSRALNVLVARVGLMLDEKDARLGALRSEVGQDQLTGVASRALMMERLGQQLTDVEREPVGAVVIVRLHDLVGMNQRVGRERTDEFLRAVATGLRTRVYPHESEGAVLARLNGADFCILLPGVDEAALRIWLDGLASLLAGLHDDRIAESWNVAWLGATLYRHAESLSDVMTRADAMVMACEAQRERFCVTSPHEPLHRITVAQWRELIENALDSGQVQLAFYPVQGRGHELLHREAMLRLRSPDGRWMTASVFVPPAIRTGRVIDLDLRAIELALAALAQGAGDVAVNLSAQSIRRPIFLRRLGDVLRQASPGCAQRLWLEVDELGLREAPDELRRLSELVQPYGCRLGIEHFGQQFATLMQLPRLKLDYVKLDRGFCVGLHDDPGRQAFARTVRQVCSARGVRLIGEGLSDARDLEQLQQLGFDGATGPLVTSMRVRSAEPVA